VKQNDGNHIAQITFLAADKCSKFLFTSRLDPGNRGQDITKTPQARAILKQCFPNQT